MGPMANFSSVRDGVAWSRCSYAHFQWTYRMPIGGGRKVWKECVLPARERIINLYSPWRHIAFGRDGLPDQWQRGNKDTTATMPGEVLAAVAPIPRLSSGARLANNRKKILPVDKPTRADSSLAVGGMASTRRRKSARARPHNLDSRRSRIRQVEIASTSGPTRKRHMTIRDMTMAPTEGTY